MSERVESCIYRLDMLLVKFYWEQVKRDIWTF